jgi:hypothetical protein
MFALVFAIFAICILKFDKDAAAQELGGPGRRRASRKSVSGRLFQAAASN